MGRRGDIGSTSDDTCLQLNAGSTRIPEDEAVDAARFVERKARDEDDCRQLLNALGLAPTTTTTGGTR